MARTPIEFHVCQRCRIMAVGYNTVYCRSCGVFLRRVWGPRQMAPDPPWWQDHLDRLAQLADQELPLFPNGRDDD